MQDKGIIGRSGRWVESLARMTALAGGIVLVLVAILTGVSILGRWMIPLGLKAVPGDFELVEAGIAFAVTAFLPWCHLMRGHATVTLVSDQFGRAGNAIIDLLSDLLLTGLAVVLTWRHLIGMLDKQRYGETTFILQFPLWWSYAACLLGLAVWIIAGLWSIADDTRGLATGRYRESESGAVH